MTAGVIVVRDAEGLERAARRRHRRGMPRRCAQAMTPDKFKQWARDGGPNWHGPNGVCRHGN